MAGMVGAVAQTIPNGREPETASACRSQLHDGLAYLVSGLQDGGVWREPQWLAEANGDP